MRIKFFEFMKKNYLIASLLLFFIVLYSSTIYPGVGGRINYGDSAKWQFLWAIGGTPHSTGYPLFLGLSALFGNLLIFLEPYLRITLISLVSAVGTLFVLYKISEIFINTKLARILPTFLLGTTYIFWSQATEAEVYTLNALFVSLVIYFFILFYTNKKIKNFLIGIIIYAISFGNHLSMITLLPGLVYMIFFTGYKLVFNKKNIILCILIFLLGSAQYLYVLYLSHTNSPYLEFIGHNSSITHWISYITGGQFRNNLGANNTFDLIYYKAMPDFINAIWIDFGLTIIVVIFFFIFYQKVIQKSYNIILVFLALIGFFELINALSYNIGDIIVYYIPAFLITSLLLAKVVDLIKKNTAKNILIIIIICSNIVIATKNYKKIIVSSNPIYENITNIFNAINKNSTLFIPREGIYHYHAFEALKYAEYVGFSQKNIHHICTIDYKKPKEFFTLASFVKKIPLDKFTVVPTGKNLSLFDLILKNKNYLTIISGKDECTQGLTPQTINKLLGLGLHFQNLKYRGSYIAIIYKGKTITEKVNNNGPIKIQDKKLKELGIDRVVSSGFSFGNNSEIIFQGKNLSLNKRGLNIAIIDDHNVIKKYNIDTYKTIFANHLLYKVIPKQF